MKKFSESIVSALVSGVLIVVPGYLAVLMLLKAMKTVAVIVKPLAAFLPEWIPAERVLSLLLVLIVCILIGAFARTVIGRKLGEWAEKSVFERIPGYTVFRSMAQQLTGHGGASAWKPALVEIEEALVPAFIVEELTDGRFTVFVPSVPTPLAGAIYILARDRVHPVNVPFTKAIRAISQWGSGSKDLVAAMKTD